MKIESDVDELRETGGGTPPAKDRPAPSRDRLAAIALQMAKGNAPEERATRPAEVQSQDRATIKKDLEATYKEIEALESGVVDDGAEVALPDPATEEPVIPKTGGVFDKFSAEYDANGKLSDESYAELAKMGIDRALVDTFIDDRVEVTKVKREVKTVDYMKIVGGADRYKEISKWASTNLSKEERDAFNEALSGSDGSIRFALEGLNARFLKAQPAPRTPMLRGTPATSGSSSAVKPFTSMAQLIQAQKDPRYQRDEEYREQVLDRLRVSNI